MMNLSLLLSALIAIESNGDSHAVGDNGAAVGCLQIHPSVITDVNVFDPTGDYRLSDREEVLRSRQIATLYLVKYLQKLRMNTGQLPTYEAAARIWNGGYHGYLSNREATDNYWEAVRAELRVIGVEESEL